MESCKLYDYGNHIDTIILHILFLFVKLLEILSVLAVLE